MSDRSPIISNRSDLTKYLLRGGILLLTFFILISLHRNIDTQRSGLQKKYENWLEQLNQQADQDVLSKQGNFDDNLTASIDTTTPRYSSDPVVSGIDINLSAENSGQQMVLVLNARQKNPKIDAETRRAQLVRILELIKEANLFSLPEDPQAVSDPSYEIKVNSENESFVAKFSQSQISSNTAAQLLLKLLQIYGDTPTKSLALENLNNKS